LDVASFTGRMLLREHGKCDQELAAGGGTTTIPRSFPHPVHKDRQQTSESSTKMSIARGGVGRISNVLADFVGENAHYFRLATRG
jgi:hypothetical protein